MFERRTEDEKAADKAEKVAAAQVKDAQKAARETVEAERKAAEAFSKTPLGMATIAKQNGDAFFQVDIDHSMLTGAWFNQIGGSSIKRRAPGTDLLGRIEAIGWHLEHVNHVFIQTGTDSEKKMLSDGVRTDVRGRVTGIYLFRSAVNPD